MKIVYTDDHRAHFPQGELHGGELVTPFERPSRVEYILRELNARKMNDLVPPGPLKMQTVKKVHDKGFLEFLENAWSEWLAAGYRGEILPTMLPVPGLRRKEVRAIDGKVGYYTFGTETMITAGTWKAATASALLLFRA